MSLPDPSCNPDPSPITPERWNTLIENGKLKYAYLSGTFVKSLQLTLAESCGDAPTSQKIRVWQDFALRSLMYWQVRYTFAEKNSASSLDQLNIRVSLSTSSHAGYV
jgi:hypothetical protein